MNRLKINKTFELIKTLQPMIKHQDLDRYEEEHGLGWFDVVFRQKDDEKTIWGNPEIRFDDTDLRSLMNNIYDYLAEGYEMWIRETPDLENDSSTISDESMRYAISLQAYNFDDDMIPLDCRIVSGWLVISLDFDATFDEERKFFAEFGYEDYYMLGPTLDDVTGYLMDSEISDLCDTEIKKYKIKITNTLKTKCIHCRNLRYKILESFKKCDEHSLEENFEKIKSEELRYALLRDTLPEKEYNEAMYKIEQKKVYFEKNISDKIDSLKEFFVRLNEQKYYVCNICKSIFCDKKMFFNRVCHDCGKQISNRIFEEKGYHKRFIQYDP